MDDNSNSPLWREVEGFYRREVLLLQDRRYRDWLKLMDGAIRYRVPVTTSTLQGLVDRDDELGYYDEDLELLNARVAKLESRQSWVEQPPSRLRYFIQLIDVSQQEDGAIVARSNLLLLQYRWNMEQQFSGGRTDTLIRPDGELRLRNRHVVLDRQAVGNQGLSVFF
ncbi:MAG: aromatic-ring-hydroxylating dioxygenase subunit beta [Burkholderiales bacterium]|nr:aromatic-ring-hydroxylating dioxygenase subunit beta [Burkholderiales bacterium]